MWKSNPLVSAALAAVLAAAAAPTQSCLNFGPGCPANPRVLTCSGGTRIGNTLGITAPVSTPDYTAYLIGVLGSPIYFGGAPGGPACCPQPAILRVAPIVGVTVQLGTVLLPIPQNPSLIGTQVCVQGAIYKLPITCLRFTNAVCFQILP